MHDKEMKLSEYLIEAVAKRTTGKYLGLSTDMGFLRCASVLEKIMGVTSRFLNSNIYVGGGSPYKQRLVDTQKVLKEINYYSGTDSKVISIDEHGALLLWNIDSEKIWYIAFFDDAQALSSIYVYTRKGPDRLYLDHEYTKNTGPKSLETGINELNKWLYETNK